MGGIYPPHNDIPDESENVCDPSFSFYSSQISDIDQLDGHFSLNSSSSLSSLCQDLTHPAQQMTAQLDGNYLSSEYSDDYELFYDTVESESILSSERSHLSMNESYSLNEDDQFCQAQPNSTSAII